MAFQSAGKNGSLPIQRLRVGTLPRLKDCLKCVHYMYMLNTAIHYIHTVQPAWNLHKPSDSGGQNYPRAVEHPLTLVVMILAFRDDRTRGIAEVAREGSSRSTVFHRLHNVHVNCII